MDVTLEDEFNKGKSAVILKIVGHFALVEVENIGIRGILIDDVQPKMTENNMSLAKFPLGNVVSTPSALNSIPTGIISDALERHKKGDWGNLDEEDKATNEDALLHNGRLLSAYKYEGHETFWIITEADRSSTTVLLPSDY